MEKGVSLPTSDGVRYLYHDPCHTPIKHYDPLAVAAKLVGQEVVLSDRCCGEAGTFAVSRPDIATQVRFRKEQELRRGVERLTAGDPAVEVKLLTTCPACLQGLARYRDDVPAEAEYIVTALAEGLLGEQWERNFLEAIAHRGIEHVLL